MAANAIALKMLEADLGYLSPPPEIEDYLAALLSAALRELDRKGVQIDSSDPADLLLHVMYAAWLYRKRATGAAMPEMLRYALRNSQVHQALNKKESEYDL